MTDREALLAFLKAAGGSIWFHHKRTHGRHTQDDLGTWRGISVTTEGRVAKIEFPNQTVDGEREVIWSWNLPSSSLPPPLLSRPVRCRICSKPYPSILSRPLQYRDDAEYVIFKRDEQSIPTGSPPPTSKAAATRASKVPLYRLIRHPYPEITLKELSTNPQSNPSCPAPTQFRNGRFNSSLGQPRPTI